jgi:hypothetical protein
MIPLGVSHDAKRVGPREISQAVVSVVRRETRAGQVSRTYTLGPGGW